eukprot:CFRG7579T1
MESPVVPSPAPRPSSPDDPPQGVVTADVVRPSTSTANGDQAPAETLTIENTNTTSSINNDEIDPASPPIQKDRASASGMPPSPAISRMLSPPHSIPSHKRTIPVPSQQCAVQPRPAPTQAAERLPPRLTSHALQPSKIEGYAQTQTRTNTPGHRWYNQQTYSDDIVYAFRRLVESIASREEITNEAGGGDIIAKKGAVMDDVVFVQDGVAEEIDEGGECMFLLQSGDYFGDLCVRFGHPLPFSVRTVSRCTLRYLPARLFRNMLATRPDLCHVMNPLSYARTGAPIIGQQLPPQLSQRHTESSSGKWGTGKGEGFAGEQRLTQPLSSISRFANGTKRNTITHPQPSTPIALPPQQQLDSGPDSGAGTASPTVTPTLTSVPKNNQPRTYQLGPQQYRPSSGDREFSKGYTVDECGVNMTRNNGDGNMKVDINSDKLGVRSGSQHQTKFGGRKNRESTTKVSDSRNENSNDKNSNIITHDLNHNENIGVDINALLHTPPASSHTPAPAAILLARAGRGSGACVATTPPSNGDLSSGLQRSGVGGMDGMGIHRCEAGKSKRMRRTDNNYCIGPSEGSFDNRNREPVHTPVSVGRTLASSHDTMRVMPSLSPHHYSMGGGVYCGSGSNINLVPSPIASRGGGLAPSVSSHHANAGYAPTIGSYFSAAPGNGPSRPLSPTTTITSMGLGVSGGGIVGPVDSGVGVTGYPAGEVAASAGEGGGGITPRMTMGNRYEPYAKGTGVRGGSRIQQMQQQPQSSLHPGSLAQLQVLQRFNSETNSNPNQVSSGAPSPRILGIGGPEVGHNPLTPHSSSNLASRKVTDPGNGFFVERQSSQPHSPNNTGQGHQHQQMPTTDGINTILGSEIGQTNSAIVRPNLELAMWKAQTQTPTIPPRKGSLSSIPATFGAATPRKQYMNGGNDAHSNQQTLQQQQLQQQNNNSLYSRYSSSPRVPVLGYPQRGRKRAAEGTEGAEGCVNSVDIRNISHMSKKQQQMNIQQHTPHEHIPNSIKQKHGDEEEGGDGEGAWNYATPRLGDASEGYGFAQSNQQHQTRFQIIPGSGYGQGQSLQTHGNSGPNNGSDVNVNGGYIDGQSLRAHNVQRQNSIGQHSVQDVPIHQQQPEQQQPGQMLGFKKQIRYQNVPGADGLGEKSSTRMELELKRQMQMHPFTLPPPPQQGQGPSQGQRIPRLKAQPSQTEGYIPPSMYMYAGRANASAGAGAGASGYKAGTSSNVIVHANHSQQQLWVNQPFRNQVSSTAGGRTSGGALEKRIQSNHSPTYTNANTNIVQLNANSLPQTTIRHNNVPTIIPISSGSAAKQPVLNAETLKTSLYSEQRYRADPEYNVVKFLMSMQGVPRPPPPY